MRYNPAVTLLDVTLGSGRFWCPETPQYVVGVSATVLVVAGAPGTYLWSVPSGELLAVWSGRPLARDTDAVAREADALCADVGGVRRWYDLRTGALRAEAPAPPAARIALDDARTTVTVTAPDGRVSRHPVPWSAVAAVARDGARFAVATPGEARVYDARDGGLVFSRRGAGYPTLSADGATAAFSLLGPPRMQVYDVDRGLRWTPDEPPSLDQVVLTAGPYALVDAAVWDLRAPGASTALAGARSVLWSDAARCVAHGPAGVARYDLASGARERFVPFDGSLESACVDANGRTVVATFHRSRGLLHLGLPGVWRFDLESERVTELVATDGGAPGPALALHPTGGEVALTHDGVVRFVDRAGAPARAPLAVDGAVRCAWSPAGALLAVWSEAPDAVTVFDGATVVARFDASARGCCGWDGEALVWGDGRARERCDPRDGRVLARWSAPEPARRLWVGGGRYAVSVNDGTLRVRDLVWGR